MAAGSLGTAGDDHERYRRWAGLMANWPWVLVGLAGAVTSAVVLLRLARRRRARRTWRWYEMTSWSNADMAAVVRQASNEQLCWIWRFTGAKLRADQFPSTIGMIAEIRRLALDELAARDPQGFARWLAGQPHVTDPRTYIRR
jgi:hypothetical protein